MVQLKTPYTVYTICINLPKNIIGIITLGSLCKILCCCNPQVVDYIHPLFLFSPRLHTAPWTLLKLPVKIPQIIPLKMFVHPMSFKLKVSWSWGLIQFFQEKHTAKLHNLNKHLHHQKTCTICSAWQNPPGSARLPQLTSAHSIHLFLMPSPPHMNQAAEAIQNL